MPDQQNICHSPKPFISNKINKINNLKYNTDNILIMVIFLLALPLLWSLLKTVYPVQGRQKSLPLQAYTTHKMLI